MPSCGQVGAVNIRCEGCSRTRGGLDDDRDVRCSDLLTHLDNADSSPVSGGREKSGRDLAVALVVRLNDRRFIIDGPAVGENHRCKLDRSSSLPPILQGSRARLQIARRALCGILHAIDATRHTGSFPRCE